MTGNWTSDNGKRGSNSTGNGQGSNSSNGMLTRRRNSGRGGLEENDKLQGLGSRSNIHDYHIAINKNINDDDDDDDDDRSGGCSPSW
jgi:hypothetical protein